MNDDILRPVFDEKSKKIVNDFNDLRKTVHHVILHHGVLDERRQKIWKYYDLNHNATKELACHIEDRIAFDTVQVCCNKQSDELAQAVNIAEKAAMRRGSYFACRCKSHEVYIIQYVIRRTVVDLRYKI